MIDLIFQTFTSLFSFNVAPLFFASLIFFSLILVFREILR